MSNRIDEIAERLDAIEADATGAALDAYSGPVAYRDARRLMAEVKRLEKGREEIEAGVGHACGMLGTLADAEYDHDCEPGSGCDSPGHKLDDTRHHLLGTLITDADAAERLYSDAKHRGAAEEQNHASPICGAYAENEFVGKPGCTKSRGHEGDHGEAHAS